MFSNSLQNIMIQASVTVFDSSTAVADGASGGGARSDGSGKKVGALELAKLLCASFSAKPISEVVMDDDEDASFKRIVTTLSMESESVVKPLSDFVDNKLSLPLILHDAPREVLRKLSVKAAEHKKYALDLIDLLTFAQREIHKLIPTSWLTLAIDTSDLYAVRDKFVDKTQEVINNGSTLDAQEE